MKICPKCAAQNKNSASFCAECGESLADVAETAPDVAGTAADLFGKAKKAAQTGAEKAQKAASEGMAKVQEQRQAAANQRAEAAKTDKIFIDQSETMMASIGNGYLQNILMGGKVKTGFGLLSQKRFYYKGKNYTSSREKGFLASLTSTTEEGVVSVDDISFTGFTYTRPTGLLLSAILLLIATFAAGIALWGSPMWPASWIFAVAALLFFVRYFISRQTLFVLSFPGGGFGFDVKYYPITDIQDFQRQLHLLKDQRKDG